MTLPKSSHSKRCCRGGHWPPDLYNIKGLFPSVGM